MNMDYEEAEAYILAFTNYEKTPGVPYTLANYDLRRMDELLQPLGNPQLAARTVHIAGTKGKGSTAAMIAQVLSTAGYRTGLYTSPHLITMRERIRIADTLISEDELSGLTEELKPLIETVNQRGTYGQLTTFEVLTALAFVYYQRKHVEFQVLEVGLGGRLDATNVVKPEVCVITSISLDHMDALGDTVAKIATEKAGIIKPGCIVVSGPQAPEAAEVIAGVRQERRVPLLLAGRDFSWKKLSGDLTGQSLAVNWGRAGLYNLRIPLLGAHQLENAAVAVTALQGLVSRGFRITDMDIVRGLAQVDWPGRLQILRESPYLVVDGAHNGHSAGKLVQALKETFKYDDCFLVCGMSGDKDIQAIVEELVELHGHVIVTRAEHPRAAATSLVAAEFARYGVTAAVAENVAQALSRALAQAKKTDLICVTGSLFVVAEAITYAREHFASRSE